MFIKEVMLAPVITKEMIILCAKVSVAPPTFTTYFPGPQYLVPHGLLFPHQPFLLTFLVLKTLLPFTPLILD